MKSITVTLKERIQNAHPRTRKTQLNIVWGLVVKGGGMLISLVLVPITIDYLSKDAYGTWLTISSVVTMLAFMDIGIGNGLRNKFSEAVTNQNTDLANAYVSTAYLIFGLIQLGLVMLFLLIYTHVPWGKIFNTNIAPEQLQTVILLTVTATGIKLVLDILSYVLYALQESGRVGLITMLSNGLILAGIFTLKHYTHGNLNYLAAITTFSPIIVLLISGFLLYRTKLKPYQPAFKRVDLQHARSLLSLGYKFFLIQMAAIVLFYTDNLIITQLFGPGEVTTYNVAFRYFNAINTIFAIIVTPYWSAFTEASVKADIGWMKSTHLRLQKMWLGLVAIVLIMILISDKVYALWIGDRVVVPMQLSICMGLFTIVSCWNSIITAVVNGLGKVRMQLYYALFAAIINVPLAILLGRKLNMGSAGVILATSLSLLFCSGFGGIQAKKLVSSTAKGIWNQ